MGHILLCTVKLDFKNRQVKNQLGFKNQINNDQLDQISFKNYQDKNNLTLRTKMGMTKMFLKSSLTVLNFNFSIKRIIYLLLKKLF